VIGLHSRIQPYAWGSRSAIARLQGRPVPAAGPEAELWLGAHPAAPSTALLAGGARPLTDLIAADPGRYLGAPVVAEFGPRLPFLLKVLAAAEPLSLQAHPDAAQAAEGHARDPGTYADPYHKPELLVALDEFEALCGFRDPLATAELLAGLDVAALLPLVDVLHGKGLRGAVELLLGLPPAERVSLVDSVAGAHPLAGDLAARYPGDVGVVLALLLNHVTLRPGEAVFMPAGNLHAYLRGLGVEVMAASDNVLRGGLTPKKVDPPELMRLLRYEVLDDPVVRPVSAGEGLVTWPTPVPEFSLVRAVPAPSATLPGAGPRIVVCVAGTARLRTGESSLLLGSGEAVFVTPEEPPVTVTGDATVFQASPSRSA
jgi:mannose-6-phosphate isomerase